MKYDLEIDKIIRTIKKEKAKLVCLQLPEGLKLEATKLVDKIEKKTKAKCLIWLGSCYGACDLPLELKNLNIDLIIQLGHSPWPYKNKNIKILNK
ncbi:MAG: diphthamide synthesis protein [Candidatus Pacearchaeota archaeon]|nr:MAG: diphthamide synthesis protein [Candidatus Pacearchaeota archaeon]